MRWSPPVPEFFALPSDVKQRSTPSDPSINRGYAARGTEALSYSIGRDAPPDLFEAYNIGEDNVDYSDPFYAAEQRGAFAPNIWPDEAPELRPALVDYFSSARQTGVDPDRGVRRRSWAARRMVRAVRRPLDDDDASHPLRASRRRGRSACPVSSAWERTPTTASSPCSSPRPWPACRSSRPDGEWIDVIPADDALVINLGDLTAQWTNDQWRSTVHRVVPPPTTVGGPAVRRSAAFFLDGNWDARIECLPTCTSADNPPRYAPVTAGQHLVAKLMGPRLLRASDAVDTSGDRGR